MGIATKSTDPYKNGLANSLVTMLRRLCHLLGCGKAHAELCESMASSAGCGFNNMRRGTVLDKLFAEIIDGALRDRGLLHKVVPPAWLSPEMWITVLLTIVGLYKQTAFREGGRPGTRPDLHRFLTTSRLERRRGGSTAWIRM